MADFTDTSGDPGFNFDPGIVSDSSDPLIGGDPGGYTPGLMGTVGDSGVGSDTATADNLNSSDFIGSTPGQFNYADGSFTTVDADGAIRYFDSNGNELSESYVDSNGYTHLSDGSVIDPVTGDKWNSDGNLPGSPDGVGVPSSNQSGSNGSGTSLGKLSGSGGSGSPAKAATSASQQSNLLGQLGSALAQLLGKPMQPTAQQVKTNSATVLGAASTLTSKGTGVLLVAVLAIAFLLFRGRG